MNLRLRVFGGVSLLLALLLGAALILTSAAVIKPLQEERLEERVERSIDFAEALPSENPKKLGERIMEKEDVFLRPSKPPTKKLRESGKIEDKSRDDRQIYVLPGPHSPVLVEMEGERGVRWIEVSFPGDVDAPKRRVAIGLGLLILVGILLALAASRWMLKPLQLASSAMDRVADGDLSHRVPEGNDTAGKMGRSFNTMAARVQLLVEGQQELMAGVSHELRTPLARLRLHSELLRDQNVDAKRLDAMESDIAEVDGLVEELLEASRLREGSRALRLQPLDVTRAVELALGAVDLAERPVSLQLDSALCIQADERRLHRALCNVLSNIARYTPDDAPVRITGQSAPDGVWLEIADGGPGVEKASIPQLFEPFFREERSRSKVTGGLGLGLMLVKRIVEAHGARIQAKNAAEGGLVLRMGPFQSTSPTG